MHPKIPLKIKLLDNYKTLDENQKISLPQYTTLGASGLDVRAQILSPMVLRPLERTLVPTGLAMSCAEGYEIQVRPRSGLAAKEGISVLNTPGTVDRDYRGEVKVIVVNLSKKTITIQPQDRIAQLVYCPVVQAEMEIVTELPESQRDEGGFGSTGKK